MTSELKLYSKSGVQTDWLCPRKRMLAYEFDGVGITNNTESIELTMGAILHDGFAAIATLQKDHGQVDIDPIATSAHDQMLKSLIPEVVDETGGVEFAYEQATLVEGLLRGFHRHIWPRLMVQYPIIKLIEQSMVYKHDGLGFMSKPDIVVQDPEGANFYLEYKSTSSKRGEWINSWNTAIQVHSTIRAIEATINEPVTGVIIQGIYKGFESYGKQSSPMCYCYMRSGNPPFSQDQIRYEYQAGFKRKPTWELDGGVKKWVEEMPEDILANQFPQTPAIFINNDLIDAFFRQRAIREHEIQECDLNDLRQVDKVFPQRWDQCWPAWGRACQFTKICHGPDKHPLDNGFVYRDHEHLTSFKELL